VAAYVVHFAFLSACSTSTSGSQQYASRLSTICAAYNKPTLASANADAATAYAAYGRAVLKRRQLLDRLAAVPGPRKEVSAVRRRLLDPSYAELQRAQEILAELRVQAGSRASRVSERTVTHMLELASLDEPINDFLAVTGLTACMTT
jgi:hypothetical protein